MVRLRILFLLPSILLALALFCAVGVPIFSTAAIATTDTVVVDLISKEKVPNEFFNIAISAAAGLFNRGEGHSQQVIVLRDSEDISGLNDFYPENAANTRTNSTLEDFLYTCMTKLHIPILTWSNVTFTQTYAAHQSLLTQAAVLGMIPLEETMLPLFPSAVLGGHFPTYASDIAAWEDTAAKYLNSTVGLAFVDTTVVDKGSIIDFVFRYKLFVMFSELMCYPWEPEHGVLQNILSKSGWSKPTPVWGYNPYPQVFGGDLFEADTNCVNTLGAIATDDCNNLSFWSDGYKPWTPTAAEGGAPSTSSSSSSSFASLSPSSFSSSPSSSSPSLPPLLTPLPASKAVVYNASKIYVGLVYGDMDNLALAESDGRRNMLDRVAFCDASPAECFELTWTISPNMMYAHPNLLKWYYAQAGRQGGSTQFIFPPSGVLYSYPGEMAADTQQRYAAEMQEAGAYLQTTGSIHWEWELTWDAAYKNYFPLFVRTNATAVAPAAGQITSFFLNSVPYVFPMLHMGSRTYEFVPENGAKDPNSVVTFRNMFNWCPVGSGGENLNAAQALEKILAYEKGSVQYVYTIITTQFEYMVNLTRMAPEYVEFVNYQQLESLARQRG